MLSLDFMFSSKFCEYLKTRVPKIVSCLRINIFFPFYDFLFFWGEYFDRHRCIIGKICFVFRYALGFDTYEVIDISRPIVLMKLLLLGKRSQRFFLYFYSQSVYRKYEFNSSDQSWLISYKWHFVCVPFNYSTRGKLSNYEMYSVCYKSKKYALRNKTL